MPLISHHVNIVKSEEHGLCLLYAFRCDRICVLQRRVDHDHTDDRAQVRIRAECLCSRECDQDLQECIRRVAEQICKHIDGTAGVHVDKSVIDHEIQGVHDPHQETARHDRRDDRHKDISQQLDRPHEHVLLLRGRLLRLCFRTCSDACDGDKLIEDLVYCSCTEDDLELSGCLEHALDSLHIFYGCLVRFAVIRNDKAEPCRTMRGGNDILTAPDLIQNFLCGLSVIHVDSPFPLETFLHEIIFVCNRFHIFY